MTPAEAEGRIKALHGKEIRCMRLDFRGQQPIPFLRVEVFETEITAGSFHWKDAYVDGKWTKNAEIIDWKKNFIFELGGLCGIESGPFEREREGKYSFVSKANVFRVLPSGNKEFASASYEFDAEIRAEESILSNEIKYDEYQEKVRRGNKPQYAVEKKYDTDAKKRLEVVRMAKFGAQRADSGAKKRGIISMLKLPNPDKKLVDVRVFCYKCLPNFESEEVRQRYLSSDPAGAIFGSPEPVRQIPAADEAEVVERGAPFDAEIAKIGNIPALVRLSRLIRSEENAEFLSFLRQYASFPMADQVASTYGWIVAHDPDAPHLENPEQIKAFNEAWGKRK